MVSSAEHGIRFKLYHLPCHRNGVLGDAKICQTLLRQERKKPAIMRAYGCFNALWCQSMPDVGSLPLGYPPLLWIINILCFIQLHYLPYVVSLIPSPVLFSDRTA